MTKEIKVKNLSVNVKTNKESGDFICLTDMAKFKGEEARVIIANWLTTKFTREVKAKNQVTTKNFLKLATKLAEILKK